MPISSADRKMRSASNRICLAFGHRAGWPQNNERHRAATVAFTITQNRIRGSGGRGLLSADDCRVLFGRRVLRLCIPSVWDAW